MQRDELFALGIKRIEKWCKRNGIRMPRIRVVPTGAPRFAACAYYTNRTITIYPHLCAKIGYAGMAWSYPGYVIDRTPYGVLAHELGHHVEGKLARQCQALTRAEPITGYAPNAHEWFAEMFRLYVTNPDLLRRIRPTVYRFFQARWRKCDTRMYDRVLRHAPRQLAAARSKIRQATASAKRSARASGKPARGTNARSGRGT